MLLSVLVLLLHKNKCCVEKSSVRKLVIVLTACFVLSCKGILLMMHFFIWNWFLILIISQHFFFWNWFLILIISREIEVNSVARDGSRTAATSNMERFVIIVNGFLPLTNITKHSNQFQKKKCIIDKIPLQDSTKHPINTITNFLTNNFSMQHLFLWSNKGRKPILTTTRSKVLFYLISLLYLFSI